MWPPTNGAVIDTLAQAIDKYDDALANLIPVKHSRILARAITHI